MSEVNKPENSTDLKCPFDLDKYQMKIDNLAPEGSLPWAIIQVYMGKAVARSEWKTSDEYIKLTVKSPNSASHIEKHDKYSSSNWQPTSGDLMACDWELVKSESKPVECMLSFDLKIGTSKYDESAGQDWGYLTIGGDFSAGESTFGTLTNLQNNIGIAKILMFYFDTGNWVSLKVSSDQDSYKKVAKSLKKNLHVTVDGVTYNLGASSLGEDNINYIYSISYNGDNAQKLGAILKQTDQTKTFCFSLK
ncbi:DUF2829 domain-containing protein [Xenorhabdus bovienii]|uniref:Thoeris anti-defense Tad2 family protein n=1 Tax=Xenorhabdus bovienii TaxID=40576 RepID=UPI00237C77B6|nr:MW1434 family type I TA system toxin [Xenorhabdus bovienii]MDE1497232.1 DUF2829 domain-containing protein [Xenorhabdus bovienii]MDE9475250.1 DUF2829 domain-containing protein [Xenorhabdus bovienii]